MIQKKHMGEYKMIAVITFVLIGYLSGSILYAKIFGSLIKGTDIITGTKDKNPGTANAFMQGGFWCGTLTLVFDMLKGFLPVYWYSHSSAAWQSDGFWLALILAAPVFGHIYPVFYHFRGGKGIATTFGCLLGLFPNIEAALILAFFFLFFSLILRVTPHFNRTICTYFAALISMKLLGINRFVVAGFLFITIGVFVRLYTSKEEREKCRVRLLWRH